MAQEEFLKRCNTTTSLLHVLLLHVAKNQLSRKCQGGNIFEGWPGASLFRYRH